jgi:hypothetical protein
MSLDKLGSALSGVCILHCALLPFLLVMFPLLSVAIAQHEVYEWAFIGFSVVIAFFAMFQGYIYHKRPIPYILAVLGFGVFIVAKMTFEHSFNFSVFVTTTIYVGAGLSIFLSHWLNHKFIKHAKCACEGH